MIYAILSVLLVQSLAFTWERTKQANARADEYRHLVEKLLERDTDPNLAELVALVDRLCQRVQAPAQAVQEHALAQDIPSPPAVNLESDEDYWAAQQPTKEQLAELEFAQELNG